MPDKVRLLVVLVFSAVFSLISPLRPYAQDNVEARVDSLLKQLSLEEKVDLLGGLDDFYIRDVKHIGLPRLKMSDGPIGVRNYGPATTLAGGIALAASWDPELAQRAGAVIGQDARARGVHFMLGPGVNIYRAPMNGRNFEYFGEDPFLAARMAVGYIKGMQSQRVSATIKHFMGNNSEVLRHDSDSIIDERTMREIYLPAFEAAVKEAHVGAIMDSYNLTNGQHMTQNGYLNNDVAKKEWGFDGVMMSDWDSTYDGVAAANGGLDLEMPSGKNLNRATLLPAIKAGKVSEATIDDKVRRILRDAVRFGWLDNEQTDSSISLFNQEGRTVALDAVRSGMVLLKNEGSLLPLDKNKVRTIAVIGPGAYPGQPVGGGSAGVAPFATVSYLQGISNYLGHSATVYYQRGLPGVQEMAASTAFMTAPSGGKEGLRVEHFKSPDLRGRPDEVKIDSHIDFNSDWSGYQGLSSEFRSARWTGYYTAPTAGAYEVFLQGPAELGRGRLFLDDKLLLDNWTGCNAMVAVADVNLTAGAHKVTAELSRGNWGSVDIRAGIVNLAGVVEPEARALAIKVDVIVLAVGFDPSSESEGSDRTFRLPPGHDELVKEISAANKNTIVVVTSGGAVDASSWLDQVPALFEGWYSGQEAGTALAELLFGEASPAGKLPISWERRWEDNAVHDSYYPQGTDKKITYSEGVFVGYRHFDKASVKPLFPFGYGLSYTTFAYKNLTLSPASFSAGQPVTVGFDITNTGARAGTEIAEVYVGDKHSTVPRPVKELKGFSKVMLSPGETKHVTLALNQRAFSYYDVKNHRWTAEPGSFDVLVGPSSSEIALTGQVTLQPH